MARMIPPVIPADTPSRGEREVFQRLSDDPHTRDWIVLHSLDLAQHRRQMTGEIDFVVIVPGKGVLCLELKGSARVRREDGLWYYGGSQHGDPRGPFKQAAEAMHSLRDRLIKQRPDLSRVVFWSAVVFPYLEFREQSGEWHPWQVIDNRAFRAGSIGALIERVLNRARDFLATHPSGRWFQATSREPYREQCEAIAETMRRDFEIIENPKVILRRRNEDAQRYTIEQMQALDAMPANPRVIFEGPAGTGKTLLAIEAARRARDEGRRVMLVCFNRLLGAWLEDQTSDLRDRIVAGTLHHRMVTVAGQGPDGENSNQEFWSTELPQLAIERLLEDGDEQLYDEIIVDEAQDILRESYLDFLDLSLRGGLAAGRWRVFGDFEKQAIYDSTNLTIEEFRATRGSDAPIYRLRRNCRNTPRIANLAQILGGLQPGYDGILRPDEHVEPELHFYHDDAQQRMLLVEALEGLYRTGYSARDIVVLSPRGEHSSAAGLEVSPWKDRLRPIGFAGGHVGYCSISAFKGMEAPAVVVTDISRIGDPASTSLFYVAVTRALHHLVILAHEQIKPDIGQALRNLAANQAGARSGK